MYVLKLLVQLLRPQRRRVGLLLAAIFGATLIEVALWPALVGGLFKVLAPSGGGLDARYAFLEGATEWLDRFFQPTPEARLRALFIICGVMIATYFLRALLTYSRDYVGQYVGGRALVTLRLQLFERLQHLSLSFYESQRVGDLMSRLTTDVALIQQLITADMTNYLTAPVVVLGGIAVMFWINWKLTLLVVVFAPLTGYIVSRTGRRIRRLTRGQQERIADLNARLHERLASIRIIQSFARESYEIDEFRKVNESTFDALMRVARVGTLAPQAIQFLSTTAFVLVAVYAGVLIIKGQLSLAALAGYFALTQRVGVYFVKFGSLHLRVQQSLGALGRVSEVLAREPDIQEKPDAKPLPPVGGRIALRNVSFRYPEGEDVLKGVDLDIEPGEVVALVGPSGAGKTSLANLIMRFYDPAEGTVEIDGADVREFTLHSLRSQIGLVPQETVLFGGTIKDNILYGRIGATEEEVIAAAEAANAHPFIAALPNGYDTEVGERGVKLSGGQRQRIAIARGLLKDPSILILDEATSSLDAESEALVQEALERLMKGRTTLVIAHRLSTIRSADRILVLADGEIVEQGTHEGLLARGGMYRRLYARQQAGGGRAGLPEEALGD
jgi:subfamily B ATP-binding cassette protein MsbA